MIKPAQGSDEEKETGEVELEYPEDTQDDNQDDDQKYN